MKNLILRLSILLLFLMSSEFALAQDFHTPQNTSKKALKAFEKGEFFFQQNDFSASLGLFQKAIEQDALLIDAWLLLGDAATELDSNNLAKRAYENAIQLDTFYFLPTAYLLAKAYLENFQFDNTLEVLEAAYAKTELPEKLFRKIEKVRNDAAFRKNAYANPVAFDPKPLTVSINSPADEYVNALRLDGNLLVFTQRSTQREKQPLIEQLMWASRDSTGWKQPKAFAPDWPINQQIGAVTFSADGNSIFFAACGWPAGLGSCDIYFARKKDDEWQLPVNLGSVVNSRLWESQPSLSADGRKLLFVSNRGGGLGGSDIWQSDLGLDGQWNKPHNLGETINSDGNEMAPFLHPDGKTLYFSSDGHPGMGGADLFVSRLDSLGQWQAPVNLGYPINTSSDEINLVVEASGKTALLSALNDSLETYDILTFELPLEHQPNPVTYLQLLVKELDTKNPLYAKVILANPLSATKLIETETDEKGEAFVVIPAKDAYALQVSSKGFLFYDNFIHPEPGTDLQPAQIEVYLEALQVGKKVLLDNVLFETNKAVLLPESKAGLTYLEHFLKQNPQLKIRLEGHTDNTGHPIYNQKLSLERAGAVAEFLFEHDIDAERLEVQGFGAKRPIATNETADGRTKNRRVEMHVIAIE
ncbi:MAG: OmpA family protein [Bacteroidales bacterium]|nr:OmpA family protein [Bacteroidales bacterium]